jgi:acyl-CoA synthetase (AMP-forming)/AMP-acid ligase II
MTARTEPGRPVVIMAGTGEILTYGDLETRSLKLAQTFRSAGLRPGDHLAVLLENNPRYFETYWAAMRAGLHFTPINWHLKVAEVGYIIEDCGADAVITSAAMRDVVSALGPYAEKASLRLCMDGEVDGWTNYEWAIDEHEPNPLEEETEGAFMIYSSGTTGRPKGIEVPLSGLPYGEGAPALVSLIQHQFGFDANSVYLSPGPLYHAAPIGWSTAVQRLGGTVIVMESFDAAAALRAIGAHRVTHAHFVPTHFVRMLKLPAADRSQADLSSLELVVHAAAPCPVEVKHQVIDWMGPIVHEFYGGSEGNGFCYVSPQEWLERPGTVGRSLMGIVHILDDDGVEVPIGEAGQVWFESPTKFEYHNDPQKTADAFNDRGWSSLGDIGRLDADGYLFLTDRSVDMIISGGVNIYSQEVENELVLHPSVVDVAVIGVPNTDYGEAVKAVVVPLDWPHHDPDLGTQLIAHCRAQLAHYKCPTSVDLVETLPRLPTGKLLKRELRESYR